MKLSTTTICVLLMGLQAAHGAVVGGAVTNGVAQDNGGTFIELSPVLGFTIGADEINTFDLHAFNEEPAMATEEEIIGEVGETIPAGAVVASHYVFFDPPHPHINIEGYVEFEHRVVSVQTSNSGIHETREHGLDHVWYRRSPVRGTESYEDAVWIDPLNPKRVWVSFFASRPGDHIRVFTEAADRSLSDVPLPAPALLLGGALALLGRRRARR